jgi:BirA family biotin operon repressor/biotin-[acetyl-CoA-carboxylase] ligase
MYREKVLELLLKEKMVDGNKISEELGISRATVNRVINELRMLGYPIKSIAGRGYELLDDDLSIVSRDAASVSWDIRAPVLYFRECSSTQDIAKEMSSQGVPEGTVIVCEVMSKGRGRLGRKWLASNGGLWFTIVFKPKSLLNLQIITLAAGLSIVNSLKKLYNLSAYLKWPNDVLILERKIAGVLVEAIIEADAVNTLLVGIGVNVNNEVSKALPTAISLKEVLKRELYRLPLLKNIVRELMCQYDRIVSGETGFVLNEWRKRSATLGKKVRAYMSDHIVEGLARDIADDGCLVLETTDGEKRVCWGDIVHLR